MMPIARTMEYLREIGATPVVVEHYHKWARRKIDIWGADILAVHGRMLLAIQATTDDHHADRVTKSLDNPDVINWLRIGAGFYVYSWGKKGARGKRKLWKLKITQLSLDGDGKIRTMTHGSEIPDTGQGSQATAA